METTAAAVMLLDNGFKKKAKGWFERENLISSGLARMRVQPAGGRWRVHLRTALGEREGVVDEDVMLETMAKFLTA